eukprot:10287.XXX_622488_622957_1 [CDS] Oithona nana genome sequencing.
MKEFTKTQVIISTFLVNQASALEYYIEETQSLCGAYDDYCFVLTLSIPFLIPITFIIFYLIIHLCYVKYCKKSKVINEV